MDQEHVNINKSWVRLIWKCTWIQAFLLHRTAFINPEVSHTPVATVLSYPHPGLQVAFTALIQKGLLANAFENLSLIENQS